MNKIFKVKTKNGLAVVTSELAKNHSVVKTVKALAVASIAGLGLASQALAVSVGQLDDSVNWQIGLSADGQTVATNGSGRQILNDVQPTEKVLFSSKDGSLGINLTDRDSGPSSRDGVTVLDFKVSKAIRDQINNAEAEARKHTTVVQGGNINVQEGTNAAGGKQYTVGLNKDVNLGADGSLTVNNTKINPDGKITGVTDGDVNATSKDAVNGSQLHAVEQKIKAQTTVTTSDLNFNIVEGTNEAGGKNYDFALNNKITIGKDSPIELDGTKGTIKTGDITINDEGKITGINPAELSETSKDAVNGSQLHATNQKVQKVQDQVDMGWNLGVEGVDGGEAQGELSNVQMGDTVTVQAGKNIVVTKSGSKVKVATSERPEFKSVKVGKVSVDGEKGIDAGNTNINNVAPAEISATSKQAVNGSQLHATNQRLGKLEKKVNKLGDRIDGGLAQANAMAGLIQATSPGKSLVSASVGAYRGKQAVAVGWSGMSDNGKIIYKLGVGANTADKVNFGGNASIGYQF